MASIRIVIEGHTQEEVDKYCEMFQEMFSAPLYRHGTYNRKGYGDGYKRTTMSIPDYILRDKHEEQKSDAGFGKARRTD